MKQSDFYFYFFTTWYFRTNVEIHNFPVKNHLVGFWYRPTPDQCSKWFFECSDVWPMVNLLQVLNYKLLIRASLIGLPFYFKTEFYFNPKNFDIMLWSLVRSTLKVTLNIFLYGKSRISSKLSKPLLLKQNSQQSYRKRLISALGNHSSKLIWEVP